MQCYIFAVLKIFHTTFAEPSLMQFQSTTFCPTQLRPDIKFFCSSFVFTLLTSAIMSTLGASFFIQMSSPAESFFGGCVTKIDPSFSSLDFLQTFHNHLKVEKIFQTVSQEVFLYIQSNVLFGFLHNKALFIHCDQLQSIALLLLCS